MLTRREIVFTMSLEEIPFLTLYHQLNKYIIISKYDVSEIIDKGCQDEETSQLVAFVLGIKKHYPEGFKPETRLEKLEKKAEYFGVAQTYFDEKPEDDQLDLISDAEDIVSQAEKLAKKRVYIKRLIERFGGDGRLAKKLGCTHKTIREWCKDKGGYIYITPRYINQIVEMFPKEEMEEKFDVLINMMPEAKQDLYFRANKKAELPFYRF